MLYEALTGELPFTGTNYNALLRSIVESTPTPVKALGAGDAALSAIIDRGMAKDRAERWGSMAELGKALAHWLLSQGITEDMCGVSLEAKWLGRSTDPPSRAESCVVSRFRANAALRPAPDLADSRAHRRYRLPTRVGRCRRPCLPQRLRSPHAGPYPVWCMLHSALPRSS